jgi:hypothetical protein
MKDPEKIKIEIEPAKDTILVEMSKGQTNETFRITEDTFRNLFAGRYSTGYFSVSQDGPIYIEERDGSKVVAVQRGLRTDQKIRWDDHRRAVDVAVTTPWTYMVFKLKPSGAGYVREKEVLFIGSGPSLGAKTPLFDGQFLGNVYTARPPRFDHSNICWGSAVISPNGIVALPSLTNIVSDFYSQTFTNHIERTTDRWLEFTKTQKPFGASIGTLDQVIAGMWG